MGKGGKDGYIWNVMEISTMKDRIITVRLTNEIINDRFTSVSYVSGFFIARYFTSARHYMSPLK